VRICSGQRVAAQRANSADMRHRAHPIFEAAFAAKNARLSTMRALPLLLL
jgi:hypothetical protein